MDLADSPGDAGHPLHRRLDSIASRDVARVGVQDSLVDVARLMATRRVSCVPITDAAGRVLGMVTETRLLAVLRGDLANDAPALSAAEPMVGVDGALRCDEAWQLCIRRGVSHLAVLDGAQRLAGVVSETDFRMLMHLTVLAGQHLVPSVMQPVARLLRTGQTLREAATLMGLGDDAGVVVVDAAGAPVGVLTARDTARALATQPDAGSLDVAAVMGRPVLHIDVHATLNQAADTMLRHRVRHLVVLEGGQRLVGLLSGHDLARAMAVGLMDDAMAQDRARHRAILDALPDLVWLKDPDGVYLACNPRFEQLYGAPESQILGRTDHDFVPKDLADFFREKDRAAMAAGGPTSNEELLRFASDGHEELTHTIKTPVRDARGRLLGVLGIGRDITALRRVEDGYRRLFDSNPAPMLIYDRATRGLLAVNDAFCALYGCSRDEALQLEVLDLLVPSQHAAAREMVERNQGLTTQEWQHRRRDGTPMHVMVQSHDIERDGRACRLVVVTDITRLHDNQAREQSRLRLLDSLIRGDPLVLQLEQLALDHEAAFPGSLCSVLLIDETGQHLLHGAAPSLPDFYNAAIHGLAIGPDVGACGSAAHCGQRVISEDLAHDPRWADYLPLVQRAGLGACWSTPVLGAGGQMLGTFAAYRRHPARPAEDELEHAQFSAGLAALAITQQRGVQRLRDSERRLADTLQAVPDPIWLTDRQGQLLLANPAYRRLVDAPKSGSACDAAAIDAVPTRNRATLAGVAAAVLEAGNPATTEHRLLLPPDGREALFEVAATPMRSAGGQLTGMVGAARDITLIRQASQALADQLHLVDTMFSQTADAIALLDPQTGRFVTCNDAACRGLGYTRQEFTAMGPRDIQAELGAPEIAGRDQRAMAGETQRFDTRHRHRDGSVQQVALTLRRIDFGGRPLLSAVWQDVTESRRHAASIRRLNQAYAVLSGVNEAIVRLRDGKALLAEVCRIAVQVGGFQQAWIGRPDPQTGRLLTEATSGLDEGDGRALAAWAPVVAATLQAEAPQLLDDPSRPGAAAAGTVAAFPICPDGHPRSLLLLRADGPGHFEQDQLALYGRLVRDVGHAIESIAADLELSVHRRNLEQLVAQRTQELEQANRRLAREDLRLRAMLSLSQRAAGLDETALWQHGIDALVALVGAHCGSLHEVDTAAQQAGQPVWSAATPQGVRDSQAMAVTGLCARALLAGAPVDMAIQVSTAPRRVTAVPVQDRGRSVLLVCVSQSPEMAAASMPDAAQDLALAGADLWDIVQRRRTELALTQAKAAADTASQAKSAFLANMSHEIRTPLNAVLGFAHLLQREPLSPRQLDHLGKIADASQHLLQVINDILDFSKIEASKVQLDPTDFALQPCLQRMLAMVADKARSTAVALQLQSEPGCPALVHGDRLRLEQILLNLLSNAVKFSPQGQVTLRVAPLAPGWLRLDVTDTGIGIAPDQLPLLFKPFQQADASTTRRFGGTGLGLAICHRLAQLMGGQIGVDSQPGRGSRFWVDLPLPAAVLPSLVPPPPALPATAPPRPAAALPLQGLHVLLAEDNPINQEVALELLSAQGARVDVADDGEVALQHAGRTVYDLVLMDVQMPRLDGLRAAAAIRQLPGWQQVPIIAMTASAFPEDRADCLAAGMNDVLVKPVRPDALTQCLVQWRLDGGGGAALPPHAVDATGAAPRPPAQAPAPATPPPMPPASLLALRRLLQSHDTEAADLLARHAPALQALLGADFAALAAEVQSYAFAPALARLDALLARPGSDTAG